MAESDFLTKNADDMTREELVKAVKMFRIIFKEETQKARAARAAFQVFQEQRPAS